MRLRRETDFLWCFATKASASRPEYSQFRAICLKSASSRFCTASRPEYSLSREFVWKARPAGFAFYDIVLSNDVTKMSFWFHFVGKKLVYRCYNFHDIILSTSAVITNDMQSNSNLFVKIWNQSTISCRHNKTIQKFISWKVYNYLLYSFEPKIDCLLYTKVRYSESKSTLPQRKDSTPFRRGIPHFRQNNRKLGGNIGYYERTFTQDFKNIGEKMHLWGAHERYWWLDYKI